MSKEDHIELEGTVIDVAGGGHFRVEVETGNEAKSIVLARLAGKMRKKKIRVVLGDRVTVGVSPYDAEKGIITWRKK